MEIITVVGIGLVAAVLAAVLKQYKPEFAILTSLMAGVVIFFLVAQSAVPVFDQINKIVRTVNVSNEYIQIIFKAVGIVFITQIGYESCKDAGESALASKLELAGKFSVLLISLPLFANLITIVLSLINL